MNSWMNNHQPQQKKGGIIVHKDKGKMEYLCSHEQQTIGENVLLTQIVTRQYQVICYMFSANVLTSSYINCRVRADLPTPPLPTIITLCRASEFCPFGLAAAMASLVEGSGQRGGLWRRECKEEEKEVGGNVKCHWSQVGLRGPFIERRFCSAPKSVPARRADINKIKTDNSNYSGTFCPNRASRATIENATKNKVFYSMFHTLLCTWSH